MMEDLRKYDVKPYKEELSRRVMRYRVKRVVSPFEFYVEYSLGDFDSTFDMWFDEMQEFYNDPENVMQSKLQPGSPKRGRCYVCQSTDDNKWHRARVHHVDSYQSLAIVFLMDIGKIQLVETANLLGMRERFTIHAAQTFRGYLYNVMPKDGSYNWTPEACKFCKDFIEGKEFYGICLARSDEVIQYGLPDVYVNMGMVLREVPVGLMGNRCTVNALMVQKQYGFATGIYGGCDRIMMLNHFMPEFDDAAFDAKFPEEHTPAPAKAKKGMDRERFDWVECVRGMPQKVIDSTRPELTWLPLIDRPNQIRNELNEGLAKARLPEEIRDGICQIQMGFVTGPACIFVNLQSKFADLHKMEGCLKRIASGKKPLGPQQSHPGTFVAAPVNQDQEGGKREIVWRRGVIMTSTISVLTVLLVDYGDVVIYESHCHCRKLPEYFQSIPSFAVRVHVDAFGVNPGTELWSTAARCAFRREVLAWQSSDPVYFMFRPHHSRRVELEDFSQLLKYDAEQQAWIHGPVRGSNSAIAELKNHPLLRSLFCSIGVEILYELIYENGKESLFWYVTPLLDCLVEKGFAMRKSSRTSDAIHHVKVTGSANEKRLDEVVSCFV